MPAWRERNPADLGVTVVELLAYAGDQLSYYQDAVATEAYLNTARRRASVRRHARLVDYAMHDGANARTWLVFDTDADRGNVAAPAVPKQALVMAPATETQPALAFETVHALIELRVSRNAIQFYTWSDTNCCLPAGATRATLQGSAALLGLHKGDVLVFEEVLGAESGLPADADRTHRHVVRLARSHRSGSIRSPRQRCSRSAGTTRTRCRFRSVFTNSRGVFEPGSRAATLRSPTTDRRLCPQPPVTI